MILAPVQTTPAFSAPATTQNRPLPLADTADMTLDLSDLDTNGDGAIGKNEFAAYRSAKQQRGEFMPMDGPVSDAMQQAMFEAFLAQDVEGQGA